VDRIQTYPADEIAFVFITRLVLIHPFPNGNGRHARLMADLLIMRLGRRTFSWDGEPAGSRIARQQYIAALRAADNHDIAPLLAFGVGMRFRGRSRKYTASH